MFSGCGTKGNAAIALILYYSVIGPSMCTYKNDLLSTALELEAIHSV